MNRVAEAFVLLAEGKQPTDSELITRPLVNNSGLILLGLDSKRQRHLLINSEENPQDLVGSSTLHLERRELVGNGMPASYIDLSCTDKALNLVFEQLITDIAARIESGTSVPESISRSFEEWRALFHTRSSGPTIQEVVGLIGELEILSALAERHGPDVALDCWWGPIKHPHDFYSSASRAIEVKATGAIDGQQIHISNIEQLDPAHLESLDLVVFHLRPDRKAPSLDERVESLMEAGFARASLIERMDQSGYKYGESVTVNTRYRVEAQTWWNVTEDFPGLRSSRMAEEHLQGVSDIKYQLSLAALPPCLSSTQVDHVLDRMGDTGE